jgi:hypothetical protein
MSQELGARSYAARPESVTVIAWLLIIFGAFELLACMVTWSMKDWPNMQPIMAAYRLPFGLMLAAAAASIAIYMLCAVALLLRQGWARHVYVASALAMAAFSAWASPWPLFAMVPSLFFPLVATVFLYRPAANRWFDAHETIEAG